MPLTACMPGHGKLMAVTFDHGLTDRESGTTVVCFAAGLLQEMVRHVDGLQSGQVIMALCHIAVVQPQVTQIPKKMVKVSMILPVLSNTACYEITPGSIEYSPLLAVMMMKQYHQILIC